MNEELLARVKQNLAVALADTQAYCTSWDLCNSNPKRWLDIATMLMQGASVSKTKRALNATQRLVKKVGGQLMENPNICDLKRELAVDIAITLSDSIEATKLAGEKLRERMERITDKEIDDMDLVDLSKCESEGAKSVQILNNTLMRLRGEDIKKTMVVEAKMTYEEYMKIREGLPSKEVVEVEAC